MDYSIIIPHKNCPHLLIRCLESIPQRDNIEIIIIDDNSDVSKVDFDNFPGKGRVNTKVIFTKEAKGAGYARNVGINHAVGKWLLFADADDFYNEGTFDIFDKYRDSDYDLIFFGINACYSDSLEPAVRTQYRTEYIEQYMLTSNQKYIDLLKFRNASPCAKMVRRELVMKHNIAFDEVRASNDSYFAIATGYYAQNIGVDSFLAYCATIRRGSLTQSVNKENARSRFYVAVHNNSLLCAWGYGQYQERLLSPFLYALGHFGCKETLLYLKILKKYKVNLFYDTAGFLQSLFSKLFQKSKLLKLTRRFLNAFYKQFGIKRIKTKEPIVYLTFDDGPEPNITEFVLSELRKYGFKATFFCKGENASIYPELLECIKAAGHAIANHTYSHIDSVDMKSIEYIQDVQRADALLNSTLFRPSHGCITLLPLIKLRRTHKIIYWSLSSDDHNMKSFDCNHSLSELKSKTRPGDIVLFHFCCKHERETSQILPLYLAWLYEMGYRGESISL